MCYYDQYQMSCGDWKWGNFRQHCSKEHRTGETCGMKLVWKGYELEDKCKFCIKIDSKLGKIRKEQDRIKRWQKEGHRVASISAAEVHREQLEEEIQLLASMRNVGKISRQTVTVYGSAAISDILDKKDGEMNDYEATQLVQ